jgi:hypothetical protein
MHLCSVFIFFYVFAALEQNRNYVIFYCGSAVQKQFFATLPQNKVRKKMHLDTSSFSSFFAQKYRKCGDLSKCIFVLSLFCGSQENAIFVRQSRVYKSSCNRAATKKRTQKYTLIQL